MTNSIFPIKKTEGHEELSWASAGDSILVSDPIPIEVARQNVYITAAEMFYEEEDDHTETQDGLWSVELHYGRWPLRGQDGQLTSCCGLTEQDKLKFIDYLEKTLEHGGFDDVIRKAVNYTHLAPGQEFICN